MGSKSEVIRLLQKKLLLLRKSGFFSDGLTNENVRFVNEVFRVWRKTGVNVYDLGNLTPNIETDDQDTPPTQQPISNFLEEMIDIVTGLSFNDDRFSNAADAPLLGVMFKNAAMANTNRNVAFLTDTMVDNLRSAIERWTSEVFGISEPVIYNSGTLRVFDADMVVGEPELDMLTGAESRREEVLADCAFWLYYDALVRLDFERWRTLPQFVANMETLHATKLQYYTKQEDTGDVPVISGQFMQSIVFIVFVYASSTLVYPSRVNFMKTGRSYSVEDAVTELRKLADTPKRYDVQLVIDSFLEKYSEDFEDAFSVMFKAILTTPFAVLYWEASLRRNQTLCGIVAVLLDKVPVYVQSLEKKSFEFLRDNRASLDADPQIYRSIVVNIMDFLVVVTLLKKSQDMCVRLQELDPPDLLLRDDDDDNGNDNQSLSTLQLGRPLTQEFSQ